MGRFEPWNRRVPGAVLLAALLFVLPVRAQDPAPPSAAPDKPAASPSAPPGQVSGRLRQLSLEELMEVEVVSVSRKGQKLAEAPAAVFVITREDIRRSGATSIPEALRMAPGLHVARVDSHSWAITSRGFNNTSANKLLVMIDGRSVYSHLHSGTFWDVQDTLLEDVDRIEVIRGPGGTLWGANAVNGVINVITRNAKDTQGTFVQAGGGTEERAFGGFRHGARVGDNAYVRVYGKYFNRDESVLATGKDGVNDAWSQVRGGFRADWDVSDRDTLTFGGEVYDGAESQVLTDIRATAPFTTPFVDDVEVSGGFFRGRWARRLSETSDLSVQFHYDRTFRDIPKLFQETRDVLDVEAQHRFRLGGRQEIVWGLGYRWIHDDVENSFVLGFEPTRSTEDLISAFLQDEITIVPDRLRLILGSKFEVNDHTGFEIQPSGRILWTPSDRHTVWAAVSRAVRTPTRIEEDLLINLVAAPGPPITQLRFVGNDGFGAEDVIAHELGWRVRPLDRLSLDVASFYNRYRDLRTTESGTPFFEAGRLILPLTFGNRMDGRTWGVEAAATWQVAEGWYVKPSWTLFFMDLHTESDSSDTTSKLAEQDDPNQQFSVRSSMDLGRNFELDLGVRYADSRRRFDLPHYLVGDARLGWKATSNLDLSIVGQNLLNRSHAEFQRTPQAEIQQGVYMMLTWRF